MMESTSRGFTLMELLIAIAIIGIIMAFAIPAYQGEVERTRQTDGQALMSRVMQHQERFYTDNLTYTDDFTDLGYSDASDIDSDEGFYQVNADTCAEPMNTLAQCVELTGTSTVGGKELTLDSLGNKNW